MQISKNDGLFTLDDYLKVAEVLCTRVGLSIVGAEKVRSPEHSKRSMLKPSIIYTDLIEAVSFSSKYSWNRSKNYAVYIIPQECFIRFKKKFLNLIILDCEFFQRLQDLL